MPEETVTLAYTEWTLVDLDGERVAAFLDALARVTSYELDGRTLTLFADGDAVVRLEC